MKSTIKILVIAFCVVALSHVVAWAQQPPAFRSIKSGNWADLSTWEQANPLVPGGWQRPPDHVPSADDGQITILHLIEITSLAGVSADELVVNGQLRVRGSTLEIADGPTQQDLAVSASGILEIGLGAEHGQLNLKSGASCVIKPLGKLQVWWGGIDNSGPMSIQGTLDLNNGFIVNFDDITVSGVLRTSVGGINNIGTLLVLNAGRFKMDGFPPDGGARISNPGEVVIEGVFEYVAGCGEGNTFRYRGSGHSLYWVSTPRECISLTIASTQANGQLQNSTSSTSLDVFWPTTEAPANVTVRGNFTLNSPRTISGSLQCLAGGTLQLGAALTSNGTTSISGTIQINEGGSVIGNNMVYTGTSSALVLNIPASSAIDSANVFWPSTNGPSRVHVLGPGALTLHTARTAEELNTYTTIHGGGYLTVNKQLVLWPGGSINGAPTYSSEATLTYLTGGTYARGDEWSATSGAGYPANVFIGGNTILNYPNGSTAARAISGNLNISQGSALYMDFGNIGVNNPLTVGGSVTGGTLALGDAPGGDLHLGGSWSVGNTFRPNSRVVIFDGTTQQLITSPTTFDHLIIDNPAGVRLGNNLTVNQSLTFSAGNLILPYILTLSGAVEGASKTSHAVTLYSGYVAHTLSPGESFQFPIGGSAASYNPITIAHTGVGGARIFYTQIRDSSTVGPILPDGALRRRWGFSFSGIGGIHVTLTFQWEADDPAGPQFNPAAGVAIGQYDASQTKWIETAATYDPGPPHRATASFATTGGEFFIGNSGAFTSVEEKYEAPTEFALYQNHPNPFNPTTTIGYALPVAANVSLAVYNTMGQKVAQLVEGRMNAGRHEASFEASRLASGVYVYRLQAGAFVKSMKLLLFK